MIAESKRAPKASTSALAHISALGANWRGWKAKSHSKNYPTLPEDAPRSASRMGSQLRVQGPEDITGADVIVQSLCNFGTSDTSQPAAASLLLPFSTVS